MQPNGNGAHVLRITVVVIALITASVLLIRSSVPKPVAVQGAEERLQSAELEREAAEGRAAVAVTRAAQARVATKPALSRVESLRSRVTVERAGLLRVQETGAAERTAVSVPPLVTERIQADSAAISALSLALLWDSRAADAQAEQLAAELRARDAARITIAALEGERRPKCGRRCGIVLGAASVVALSIAVDQTRRLLRW